MARRILPEGIYDEVRRLYDKGCTDGEIEEKLDISKSSISKWRREHGLKAHTPLRGKKSEKQRRESSARALSRDAAAASAAGLTYGQWRAMQAAK